MEVIPENKVISVFATSEKDTYGTDNLTSDVVSDSFRSDGSSVTLYVGVSEGDSFLLVGTNATSATVSKGDVIDVTWGMIRSGEMIRSGWILLSQVFRVFLRG